MRLFVGLCVGVIVGGIVGWFVGWLMFPGSPLATDDLDSAMSFFSQFGGLGAGSLLGFIIGGGLASSSPPDG